VRAEEGLFRHLEHPYLGSRPATDLEELGRFGLVAKCRAPVRSERKRASNQIDICQFCQAKHAEGSARLIGKTLDPPGCCGTGGVSVLYIA
jgi:hypothetical protein